MTSGDVDIAKWLMWFLETTLNDRSLIGFFVKIVTKDILEEIV